MIRLLTASIAGWMLTAAACAANLHVADAEGRRFYLFVNGVAQSNAPLARYELHYLRGGLTELRIEMPYEKMGTLRQTVYLQDWTSYRYVLARHPLGTHLWLKPDGQSPIRTAPTLAATPGADAWLIQQERQRRQAWGAHLAARRRQAQQDSLRLATANAGASRVAAAGNPSVQPAPPVPERKPESFWERWRRRRAERQAQRAAARQARPQD